MTQEQELEALRPRLFSIACWILGSVREAERAVQETWLHHATSSTQPRSVRSFLSATVTRIDFDVLRSARGRPEQYVGPRVPEPLLADLVREPGTRGRAGRLHIDDRAAAQGTPHLARAGGLRAALGAEDAPGSWPLDIVDGVVRAIRSVNNPDKLRHLGPVVKLQAGVEEQDRARRGTR